jgi:hypothetical protein
MRRHAIWLLTLPLLLTGVEGAHALANALVGVRGNELFASPSAGRHALPLVASVLAVVLLAALAARIRGAWTDSRRGVVLAAPFALLAPIAFVLLEVSEALALPRHSLLDAAFFVGFALQLPMAIGGYFVARALLRLTDDVRARLAARRPVPVAITRAPRVRTPLNQVLTSLASPDTARGRAPPFAAARSG